jgi:polyhydroxybutyrate depolymerase|tara:strand:- start:349 stop:1389 length:1041 start_codon:yes stop_codon:yes gene_type:complete
MKKNSYYISLVILCVLCSISHGQQVEIDSNGDDRSFLINLPSDTNDPVPLVFILHGLGETGALWYGVASYIASQGIVTVRPESGTFLNNSGTGYVKLWNAILDSTRYDDVQFISDIIDYMLMNYDFIDYSKIYVLGYSNGGYMAYRLACDLSYRITAFSSVAGNMFLDDEFDCIDQSRDIPIFHVHGTEDPINSYFPGGNGVDIIDDQYLTIVESIEFWSNYHQYDISEVDTILSNVSVRYTYTNDAVTSSFEHIKVIGGGHEYFYGEDFGFSSTQESIDYFLQFELSDFIINQEDTNGDGLYNTDDINIVVDYIFEQSQNSTSYDFNLDQNVDLFDVLILSDTIF